MKKTKSAVALGALIISASTMAITWPTPPTGEISGGLLGNLISPDTENGRVGIGTTSPLRNLHIHNNANADGQIKITNIDTGIAGSDGFNIGFDAAENALVWNRENTPMYFAVNNASKMVINNDGNVGIGTTEPGERLDTENGIWARGFISSGSSLPVLDTTAVNAGILLGEVDIDARRWGIVPIETSGEDRLSFYGVTSSVPKELVVIERITGNVGIGTTDPGAKLHVISENPAATFVRNMTSLTGTTTTMSIRNEDQTDGNSMGIDFQTYDSNSNLFTAARLGVVVEDHLDGSETSTIRLGTAANSNLVIDQNGNVGIGTMEPGVKLDVRGNDNALMVGASASTGVIKGFESVNFGQNSVTGGDLILRGGRGTGVGEEGEIIFQVGNNANWGNQQPASILEAMRIQKHTGNVGIGTTEPGAKLTIYGASMDGDFLTLHNQAAGGSEELRPINLKFRYNTTDPQYLGIEVRPVTDNGTVADMHFTTPRNTNETKMVSSQNSNVNPKNPISSSSVYAVSRISCEGVTLKFWEDTENGYKI